MKKPTKREHGIHHGLISKTDVPCPSCGGKKGWHKHVTCEGLGARWGSCIVTHMDEQRGARHCRLPHGWEVTHRMSWRGGRLHFHQYTGEGLYCEHHARELAAHLNRPAHQHNVA